MPEVLFEAFEPTSYRENGLFIVDLESLKKLVKFEAVVSQVVSIPPGQIGGNHKHPRQESFVCFDPEAEFHWIDGEGEQQKVPMMVSEEQCRIVSVAPYVPHGIKNSSDHSISVIEFADAPQTDVEIVEVA